GVTLGTIDGVVCNFALHYMCDSLANLRNLLYLNARLLKMGGSFVFTVMDGKRVFALLQGLRIGQQWQSGDDQDDAAPKYAIKKLYSGDTMTQVGQTI